MATSKKSLSNMTSIKGGELPKQATSSSTVSPQQLEQFVNFLPEGKRSPIDFANEMSRRGYAGAADMYKGAQDTQAAFAKDGRLSPDTASQDYTNNRKYSQLWHTELIQSVLSNAKRLGMKDKNTILANKDILLKNTRFGPENFNAIMSQNAGGGESKADNFWRTTGDLYNDLQKREQLPKSQSPSITNLANKSLATIK